MFTGRKNSLLAAVSLVIALTAPQALADKDIPSSSFLDEGASLGVGLTSREGMRGYYVDLNWQFSRYASVGFDVQSYLNPKSYPSGDFVAADALDDPEEKLSPSSFRPRHNTFGFKLNLRFPIDVNDDIAIAPFVELGVVSLSTKSVTIYEGKELSGGSTDSGSDSTDSRVSHQVRFDNLEAFRVGAGMQFVFGENHSFILGYQGFANDKDWSELAVNENEKGGWFRYEYRPTDRLGAQFGIDAADQFGDPRWFVGINWKFN